jgi:hypothetical protein
LDAFRRSADDERAAWMQTLHQRLRQGGSGSAADAILALLAKDDAKR